MTTVYITGASAGLGRAIAQVFSADNAVVGLLARDEAALMETARELPGKSSWAVADVGSYESFEAAVQKLERDIGAPDIWINNAMTTIFSRFEDILPDEFAQAVNVTFLGSVYGLQLALKMVPSKKGGHIIQIGSALAYRAIPLQAPYCASKMAVRGAVDSLRCELIHDKSPHSLTMVHMPAMNTPQFDWARRRIPELPQPVPPIYAPEACARAVLWASKRRHIREVWVGKPTWAAILGNKLMPAVMDHYMADNAYEAQFEKPDSKQETEGNLFHPLAQFHRTNGRFKEREIQHVLWIGASEKREKVFLAVLVILILVTIVGLIAI